MEIFGDYLETSFKKQEEEFFDEDLDYSNENLTTESTDYEEEPVSINHTGMEEDTTIKEEKPKQFGDHILVDKIAIKNEPKLMAEAIRTMLSKDE
ncbi:MAG: hypothetical protein KatS3mg129_1853 [Leptospiraceae bacterium]|nr:MAG: hypothetical protein KatS3mg129_1853 [Leptospiraceae bacterium]